MTSHHRARKAITAAAFTVLIVLTAACSNANNHPLGPPNPSGGTPFPGGPMEPIPIARNPKIPTSQQEAQNTVLKYLQDTLNTLPPGSTLDGTRYSRGRVIECDDNDTSPDAPIHFEDLRDMTLPAGTDFNAIIHQVGELWKSWGWQVLERNGFDKPNRFGYAPDGYSLDIQARVQSDYAPTMSGGSPCFSGALQDKNSLDGPAVITQTTG